MSDNGIEAWHALRARSLEAVELLAVLLREGGAAPQRLMEGYLDAKHELASSFRVLASEFLIADPSAIEDVKRAVEAQMKASFSGILPERFLSVKGYGSAHSLLYAYLATRVGQFVSAAELRVLTADAVHTERRVRELRDLGCEVDAEKRNGQDMYGLKSLAVDVTHGARKLVTSNLRNDKGLKKEERDRLLIRAGLDG